jgi:hypothetical protein
MATPKLLEAACKGSHASQGGPDDGSHENFVYGGPENADGPAVQTGAWVAHAPHGEDSLGLWQINIDPAQTDNPDTFDCSEIVQWASGPAVQTGAWVADVTYERAASQLESANNLKQLVLAVHALDASDCSVDICAQNSSPSASPAPGESVHGFGLDRGHMGSSFDLVFPPQTAFPQRESNAVGTESLKIAHEGFLGDHDDGWCMGTEIDFPENTNGDDDTSSCTSGSLAVLLMDAPVASDFFLI